VLWDVDGTLLDSAELHFLAWRDTVAQRGFALTRERFAATFGHRNDAVLRDYFGPGITADQILEISTAKEGRFRELLGSAGLAPLPGVARWLAQLRADGWRQAVASSAQPASLEAMLGAIGLAEYFAAIVSARDVARGKPAPDVFLLAAERLGVPPARCVVVEDAPAGLEGARAAGMRAIGVRTTHAQLSADVVVDTLDLLPGDCFERLLIDTL
jgi:beta-phosphoglucomutase